MNAPLTAKDYKSEVKPVWCPGCGDFSVLSAVTKAMAELQLARHQTAFISGIGCSSRIPAYASTYGFHGIHGRSLAIATGVKMARPDLTVIVAGGDGDGLSIGGNHFLHACRRNVDMTYIIMDNQVYGMTKGQASPTTAPDWCGSKLTPLGPNVSPVQPLTLALTCGANFLARGFSGDPNGLAKLIAEGIKHPGFSLIHVLSPCVTFRPEQREWKQMVHDSNAPICTDPRDAARRLIDDDGFSTGVFYAGTKPAFQAPPRGTATLRDLEKQFILASGGDALGDFLAHALALENEAAERYDELADAMSTHNNSEVAGMFRRMAEFSRKHAAEVAGRVGSVKVPHLAPWEFKWPDGATPEVGDMDESHYLMTPYHVLAFALHNEQRGYDFYNKMANESKDPEVRRLAKEFSEEEEGHVATLKQWLTRFDKPEINWDEDADPPTSAG